MAKSVTENLSVNNLDFKQSVRAATTANITLSGTQTIDGVALVAGDRVLVKNQTTASQNGIYLVNASTWNRSLDANEASEFTGNFVVFVEEGTSYKDTGWILITNNPITVGSTSLSFTLLTRASDSNGNIFLIPDSTGDVGISTLTPNARLHVYSSISGDTVFNVEGTNGSLFSITDNLTGSLMSVNNNAGLPVFEVFSTDKVVAGRFGQNDLVVNTDGKIGLGTTSPSEKLEVSGNVKITQATVSTSTATGTLILSGTAAGVGIAGNINVGGTVNNFSGNTASTTTGTGTLVVTGGVGVSGNLHTGGAVVTNTMTANAIYTGGTNLDVGGITLNPGAVITTSSLTYIDETAVSSASLNTESLNINNENIATSSELNINLIPWSGNSVVIAPGNIITPTPTSSTSTSTGSLVVVGGVGVSGNIFSSAHVCTATTASTSTATGTLILSGTAAGAGISGNINVGGTVNNFSGNTASTTTGTGTLVVTGGVGVSGNVIAGAVQNTPIGSTTRSTGAFTTLTSNGATTFTAATASTTTGTGTLVVTGGVGVSGNVNIGGSLNGVPASNIPPAVNLYLFQNFK